MQKKNSRYTESLRRYAQQWTDAQIREAIEDERRTVRNQSLSPVAMENSQLICSIYEEVLSERDSDSAA